MKSKFLILKLKGYNPCVIYFKPSHILENNNMKLNPFSLNILLLTLPLN